MENRNDNDWIEVIREKYLLDAGAPTEAGWDAINRRLHRPVWLRRTAIAASILLPIAVGLLILKPWHKPLPYSEDIIAVTETTAPSTPPSKDNIINPTDVAPTASSVSRPVVLQSTHKGAQVILPGESEQALTSDNLPQESQPSQPAGSHTATFDRTTSHPQLPSEQKIAEQPSSGQQTDEPSAPVQPTFRQSLDDPFADLLADVEPEMRQRNIITVCIGAGAGMLQPGFEIKQIPALYVAKLAYINSVEPNLSQHIKYQPDNIDGQLTKVVNSSALPRGESISLSQLVYSHDFPITFGAQARIKVLSWIGLTTGIEYTYLHSTVDYVNQAIDQRLHLVGIPLRLDSYLLSNHTWGIYFGIGGKVEKCVSASIGQLKCKEIRLQWSGEAFGGIQYLIWNNMSLYIQPSLSWYFTQTDLITYRTQHPLSVSVNGGIRLIL